MKKADQDEGVIFRLYNLSEKEENATLSLGSMIKAAYITDLKEEVIEELSTDGRQVDLQIEGNKICTLKLLFEQKKAE